MTKMSTFKNSRLDAPYARQPSPSGSSEDSQSSKAPIRKVYSCEGCRKRKTKCDHRRQCSGCTMRGQVCKYRGDVPESSFEQPSAPSLELARQASTRQDSRELNALRRVAQNLARQLGMTEEDVDALVYMQLDDERASVTSRTPDLVASPQINPSNQDISNKVSFPAFSPGDLSPASYSDMQNSLAPLYLPQPFTIPAAMPNYAPPEPFVNNGNNPYLRFPSDTDIFGGLHLFAA